MSRSFWTHGGGDFWGPSDYERRLALRSARRRAVGELVGYLAVVALLLGILAWMVFW